MPRIRSHASLSAPASGSTFSSGPIERFTIRDDETEAIAYAVTRIVERGGTVIFPTDTVYGIGCDPRRIDAVEQIYALKGRPAFKALSLHLATVEEALEYCGRSSPARDAIRQLLPGALTLIVPRPAFIDREVTGGGDTLGLRVPDHPVCRALLACTGPLAATSANRSGERAYRGTGTPKNLPEATVFIDGGATPLQGESTIVDVSGTRPRLIREGVVPLAYVESVLGPIERPQTPERNV